MNRKKRFVVDYRHVGRKLPITLWTTTWLLMDRLHAAQWAWGIYWFLAIVAGVIFLLDLVLVDEKWVNLDEFLKDELGKKEQTSEKKNR
jgi:hypothetical protein